MQASEPVTPAGVVGCHDGTPMLQPWARRRLSGLSGTLPAQGAVARSAPPHRVPADLFHTTGKSVSQGLL